MRIFVLPALLLLCFTTVCFSKPAPKRSQFVVIKSVASCKASERGYAANLANQVVRWLASGGVTADLASDENLDAALSGRKLAYLVVCQSPTGNQLNSLTRFRSGGGKVAVLQSYSPQLAKFSGVQHQKSALPRTVPVKVTGTQCGWWVPNIFVADDTDDNKSRVLLSMAAGTVPGSWSAAKWEAKRRATQAAEREYGMRQSPRRGEIHAVWDHGGEGLYPGDWARTMRVLKTSGITDLFVNVAGAGFAHYPSSVLPRSQSSIHTGDQLAQCLAAARGTGIRVHAWVLCFTLARSSQAQQASFAKRGWRLKDRNGRLTEYLDPSNEGVRWHLILAIEELVRKYQVTGVHLDFVRWYEGAQAKPRNAAAHVTSFVEIVRKRTRAIRKNAWLTTAVLSGYPSCVHSVGQDWVSWIDRGTIDYAVPMNYYEKPGELASVLSRQASSKHRAAHLISGIGVTANESALTPIQVIDQINAARRVGAAGVALFDLDCTLAERVLPILRLGMMK